jgi:hypothetical protein
MTPDAFRRLALSFPDAVESAHIDHPDFRVRNKVFATLGYPDIRWGMVKLTPEQQALLVARHPEMFSAVKGGWGLRGATSIKLRPATQKAVLPALLAAWRNQASAALIRKHAEHS